MEERAADATRDSDNLNPMRRPAVFLDRDNTIIHNDGDLGNPDEVRLIQGAGPAIASLCGLGYRVVVITNQGGVARGKYTEDDVHAVHARIEDLVREKANGARIDGFYFCPYHPEGKVSRYKMEHDDRKPKPGMLLRAAADLDLDLSQSWTVGDALRDVEAGAAAGTRTVLLQVDHVHEVSRDLRREAGGRGPCRNRSTARRVPGESSPTSSPATWSRRCGSSRRSASPRRARSSAAPASPASGGTPRR